MGASEFLNSLTSFSNILDMSHAMLPFPIIANCLICSKSNSSAVILQSSDPLYQSTTLREGRIPLRVNSFSSPSSRSEVAPYDKITALYFDRRSYTDTCLQFYFSASFLEPSQTFPKNSTLSQSST